MSEAGNIQAATEAATTRADRVFFWITRIVSTLGVIVTVWAAASTGSMLVHGHPAYLVLLVLTFIVSLAIAVRSWLARAVRHRGWKVIRVWECELAKAERWPRVARRLRVAFRVAGLSSRGSVVA